ncbi:MAG: tRNA modification GTPase TrmE [Methanoregulaceae archaeon PtaB.Bin056]|nr:MAG: tRNA modification GTPase TrmE [Methanoregulaceae archaeon PtaB.Bin056]
MEFETIPTVPTADEILDRSFRRAASKMKLKKNKDRANEEFVRAVSQAIHDRMVRIIQSFPDFDSVPAFYRDVVDIMWGLDRVRQALGGVGWAARWARTHGPGLAYQTRKSENPSQIRKRAVARLSSVVHQVGDDLLFLNEVRNVIRKLPHVSDEFTVVVAGYPNVGKSSFIRLVSTAAPEVAAYPFTTKGIIVGHRIIGKERMQFIDTPGVLDRPPEERSGIERQALTAMVNLASAILVIIDASEHCGYPLEDQIRLLHEIEAMVRVPVQAVVNKSDITYFDGYINMSTETGEGVGEVLEALLAYRKRSEEEGQAKPR